VRAQALTFDVYMQTDRGSNNSCIVTAYDSQVRRTLIDWLLTTILS